MSPFLIFLGLIFASYSTCDCDDDGAALLADDNTDGVTVDLTEGADGGDTSNAGDEGTGDSAGGDATGADGGASDGDTDQGDEESSDGQNDSSDNDGDTTDSDPDGLATLLDVFEDNRDEITITDPNTEFALPSTETIERTAVTDVVKSESEFFNLHGTEGNDRIIVGDLGDPENDLRLLSGIYGGAGDDYVETGNASYVNLSVTGLDAPTAGNPDTEDFVENYDTDSGRDIAVLQSGENDVSVYVDNGDEVFMQGSDRASVFPRFEPNGYVILHNYDEDKHNVLVNFSAYDAATIPAVVDDTTNGADRTITFQNGFQILFKDFENITNHPVRYYTGSGFSTAEEFGSELPEDPYRFTEDDIPTASTGSAAADALLNQEGMQLILGTEERDYVGISNDNTNAGPVTGPGIDLTKNEFIVGYEGNDEMYGDYGSDVMFGGAGADEMSGDRNNFLNNGDTLNPDDAPDLLFGGSGEDDFYLYNGDIAHGGAGEDDIYIHHYSEAATTFEILDYNQNEDNLRIQDFYGGGGADTFLIGIASQSSANGDTTLTLTNGSTILLRGVDSVELLEDTDRNGFRIA